MKKTQNQINGNGLINRLNKVKNGSVIDQHHHHHTNNNGFSIPASLKFISSCIKTVRSAGASVAGSISTAASDHHHKDQVLWACFDRLELGPTSLRRVLLVGYSNGFQVLDVEDASNVSELVSRRDDPVSFLQMQPLPAKSDSCEGFGASHPLLLVVASEGTMGLNTMQNGGDGLVRDGFTEPQGGNLLHSPTAVRFYSLRSHNYVHVLRFRSTIYMVRCSPQIVAVGLASQIYCFDALTLENKFSVLTYPVPQLGGQGAVGVNVGYGPMAVGPRWLAYASNNPLVSNTGRLSPQSLSPSPGVSPSTSPGSGNLVARYAMESSKQLASGLINLGDMGYKTFSKYCHELLPDGSSSPGSSGGSWKVGRIAMPSPETEAAGTVVVKDFVSRAVVAQFRAHTSPISALSFDPSGTLLVTASIHGNNINIFRIMPSFSQNGSGTRNYDWTSSHVHLYKLHRGMTSAVIQDICFSHYSQWVAIVSSRGTCHIFVMSPFGGESGLQLQTSPVDGPTLLPSLSTPWWSTSSFPISQQSFSPPPPAPITLSVVSRIKNGNSGWLNTVSNGTTSSAGKASLPSGVVAAVFHSSRRLNLQSTSSRVNALEHLLVYTPSAHLIQYELQPSIGGEQGDSSLRNGTGSIVPMQEDDLRVKVEPVQWWDVCRRAEWPEREECLLGITRCGQDGSGTATNSSFEDNDGEKDFLKPHERSHGHLSNAEVQLRSGRIPIWQKSKICFYVMSLCEHEDQNLFRDYPCGETEIEKILVTEVEIRRKDLLPVFDHFHRIHSNWNGDRLSVSSLSGKEKPDTAASDSKPTSPALLEKPHTDHVEQVGTVTTCPRMDLTMVQGDGMRISGSGLASSSLKHSSFSQTDALSPDSSTDMNYSPEECCIVNSLSSPERGSISTGETNAREIHSSNSVVTGEVSKTSSNHSDMSMNIIDEGPMHEDMHEPVDFGQFFQEGYCRASSKDEARELTDAVTDIDSSNSACSKGKSEDGDSDDMLGGVFAFSEEG